MKQLLLTIMLVFSLPVFAKQDMVTKLYHEHKATGLGCVAATATASLLRLPNSLQVGLAACAGIAGYDMLKSPSTPSLNENAEDVNLKEFIHESRKAIKENHEVAKQNYSAYREVIREMLAKHKQETMLLIKKEQEKDN